MGTERLYFRDPLLLEFESRVEAHGLFSGRPSVVLARSAFYPEAGGQLADRGTLGVALVRDVQVDEQGVVHHFVEGELPALGATVTGRVERARRRQHMADHTGQHMLSAALLEVAKAPTVSSRLGEHDCTIDLGVGALTDAALAEAEALVGSVIEDDLAIEAFPTPDELAALPLRRAPTVTEGVRVVRVGSLDVSPCGGTHCTRSAQVGDVRITSTERHKGMVRVHFVAGRRGLAMLHAHDAAVRAMGQRVSCVPGEVAGALERVLRELREATEGLASVRGELGAALGAQLAQEHRARGETLVSALFEGAPLEQLRAVGSRVCAEPGVVALLGARGPEGVSVFLGRGPGATADCGALLRARCAEAGGRGGGKPERAEGRLPALTDWASVVAAVRAALA